MWRKRVKIGGMHCADCARRIERLSTSNNGIGVEVSFAAKLAEFSGSNQADSDRIVQNIEAMGFTVESIETSESEIESKAHKPLHIAIIGSGSAAFACAIGAAETGARVTMIERSPVIGGTCVNVGCIPSKIMVRAAYHAHLQNGPGYPGIESARPTVNFKALASMQRHQVDSLRASKYEEVLAGQPNIRLIRGDARFIQDDCLIVRGPDGSDSKIGADRFLIATGSAPYIPPIPGLAETPYWTSNEAVHAEKLPTHLIVIGSGIVALELSQAFLRLGSRVTLVTRRGLLRNEDEAIGQTLRQILEGEGMRIVTDARLQSVRFFKRRIRLDRFAVEIGSEVLYGDRLLVATGRRPNTADLDLRKAGVQVDRVGAILVDDRLRTRNWNIFAAGDCTDLPKYVYVAAASGARAAINMTGGDSPLDLAVMPKVIFTDPPVATVGFSESTARNADIQPEVRLLRLEHIARAIVDRSTEGFIKLVVNKSTHELIGAQIVAPAAGDLIQTVALAIRNRMTVSEIGAQLFPYLTMVEGIKLCAQSFSKDIRKLSCCAG